jgi:hypothetical protein
MADQNRSENEKEGQHQESSGAQHTNHSITELLKARTILAELKKGFYYRDYDDSIDQGYSL